MKCYVGIDIGAVSLKAVVLVAPGATAALSVAAFTPLGGCEGYDLYLSSYRRTKGRPIQSATELIEQVISAVGADNVAGICLTGGAAVLVAGPLAAERVNEFRAIALGLEALGIDARTVFEMGGQSSKYLLLEHSGGHYDIVDYSTNGDCAAGTGSFIDQQAGRLQFATEQVGRIAQAAGRSAQVAGRCSVFAKSDMIHAQQKGYSPAEVLSGLCNAVARNFRMAVVRSHAVHKPIVFIGGLAANEAVVAKMREAFESSPQELFVPAGYNHISAAGAALQALRCDARASGKGEYRLAEHMQGLRDQSDTSGGAFPTAPRLRMDRVTLLREQAELAEAPVGGRTDAYLGIDIGSVSTNLVLIDNDGAVLKEIYVRTQGRPIEVVTQGLRDIESEFGGRIEIRGVGATGSGRELIGELVGADTVNDEITAHKTGATFIGQKMLGGRVPDTIFEIGGQDSKYISLQNGVVVDFTMNEACAAGTGSFLEERAEELDISIINEFARLALSSETPIRLGERCTVFMERDVMDYLQRGASKSDLVAGLAYSVVYNYINRVVRGRPIGQTIFFQGGTAYNDAVAAAFSQVLDREVIVPPYNGVMGAIGAALLAREKMSQGGPAQPTAGEPGGQYVSMRAGPAEHAASRFRGYDMSKVQYKLREFTCAGCSNHCIMQEFDVEGEKTYWGDKCSDKYRKRRKIAAKPIIEDLFAFRDGLLNDASGLPAVSDKAPTVGIPRAMFALDSLPFWRTFWAHNGFRVVVSDPTNRQMAADGAAHAVAEPCFPVIVAHGHAAALLDAGVDYLFVPNIISAQTNWKHTESHLCPWNQTLPFVLRRVPAFEKRLDRFLSPTIMFRDGAEAVTAALQEYCRRLDIPPARVARSVAAAYQAQQLFRTRLLAAGQKALATLCQSGAPGIVIIGRPYNVHDAGVNLSVARKLRDYYGVNCLPLDCLDLDDLDIRDVNPNMFWDYGRKLLAAAKLVSRHDNLHIIHITNFKCGPDSFIKHFLRTASQGKPLLSLQFDGHSNDAGMMTRCEAYLDSKGILRPWKKAVEDAMVSVS